MPIQYVTGDATQPIKKPAIIAHIVNDRGAWGAGFVMALSRRWREPEEEYRAWHKRRLGEVQFVEVANEEIIIANMCAQGLGGKRPLDDGALEQCLSTLVKWSGRASIHMPRIGCGLAGGTWEEVEPIVWHTIGHCRDVFVYDLPGAK